MTRIDPQIRQAIDEPPPFLAPLSAAAVSKLRRAFLVEFPRCWFCGACATEVHEIANGNGIRPKAFPDRVTWASSCNHCNFHEVTNARLWPKERQLAVKLINDSKWFHLPRFNWIRGRALDAITMVDVAPYLALAEVL